MKFLTKLFLFAWIISACGPVTPIQETFSTRVHKEYQDFSYQMVWSPDDSMIALTTNTGLYLYDTNTYKQLIAFDGLGGSVVAFSESYLAAVTNRKLFVWNIEDLSLIFTKLAGQDMFFQNVAISPDNKTVVTAEHKQTRYWSLPDGKLIGQTESANFISDMAFSERNTLVIADPYLGLVQEWDVRRQEKLRTFAVSKPVVNFNLSQDGKLVVVDYGDYGFETWDVDSGKLHHGYTDIIGAPGSNSLSGDSQTVVVWGYGVGDKSGLSVWDLSQHKKISEFLVPLVNGDGWRYGALNSDGTLLAASTNEGYIYFYDLKSGDKSGEIYLPYKFTS